MSSAALITGITGQDGSYLAELLLQKGYQVFGLVRRTSTPNTRNIDHILSRITLIDGDLTDLSSLIRAIKLVQPDEVYNLGAMSHVGTSFIEPVATMEVTGLGCTRLLEAIRMVGRPHTRFYQASSSEIIGQPNQKIFAPRSPYAAAKLYAHWTTINYRDGYNMFAVNGILYNHESPRRGENFVTRKITKGVARIKYGLQEKLVLGNTYASRDWGFAGDYVVAMWLMLQQEKPKDYVIGTGVTHTVEYLLKKAFEVAGINDYEKYIEIDGENFRPNDVECLIADSSAAYKELGWEPTVSFDRLITMMVESDMKDAYSIREKITSRS